MSTPARLPTGAWRVVQATLADHDRLDDAVYGEQLGLDDQEVDAAGARATRGPYMSTVIVPARRAGVRGGRLT